MKGLNGFQKRLVHQLVRSNFPDLVSVSKFDFVQLLPYDQQRQNASDDRKNLWFEQTLAKQIGLRWVAEALCPTVNEVLPPLNSSTPHAAGDLAAIRGCNYPPVRMTDDDREAYDSELNEILTLISQKRTVVVGHK